MEAVAKAKYLRGSAQKARLVIDLIRGRNVNEALNILRFTDKRAAQHIDKCLRSAIANATDLAEKANIAVDPDDLWVKAACVDMGPTKRRFRTRPAPQGRAYRERRHYCHVTIEVSSEAGGPVKISRTRKTGGAAAAPRAKAKIETAKPAPAPVVEEVKPIAETPVAEEVTAATTPEVIEAAPANIETVATNLADLDVPAAEAAETVETAGETVAEAAAEATETSAADAEESK
jgi:large subunit ribosomal protein L22